MKSPVPARRRASPSRPPFGETPRQKEGVAVGAEGDFADAAETYGEEAGGDRLRARRGAEIARRRMGRGERRDVRVLRPHELAQNLDEFGLVGDSGEGAGNRAEPAVDANWPGRSPVAIPRRNRCIETPQAAAQA